MKRIMLFIVLIFSFFGVNSNEVRALTLNDLYNDLSALESNYAAAQKKSNMTRQELANLKASIVSAEGEIRKAQNDIVEAENDIEKSEKDIALKKDETNQMLLYLQLMNSKGDSMLEYVMDADSYTEFIYRYSVVMQMSDYNQEIITELNDLIATLKVKKEQLSQKQKDLEVKRKELQEKQIIVQTQYADEQDETLNFADQVAAKKKLIKYYENLGCSKNQNVNSCTGMAAVGDWVYPLNRWRQSSNYGYDENRYHYAVDLATPEGSNVMAVGNGEVIYSGVYWRITNVSSCGGLVVQIRHTYNGVDYISLYMHMLSSNVSVGTKVSAGQVIGTSGGGNQSIARYNDQCTGGAHLHFTMAYAGNADIYNTSSSSQGTTFNPVIFFPAFKGIGSTYNW